jgi:hypothetical protein
LLIAAFLGACHPLAEHGGLTAPRPVAVEIAVSEDAAAALREAGMKAGTK